LLPSKKSVEALIDAVPGDGRRNDARRLRDMLAEWTGEPAALWGASIIGFGLYRYRYDTGREGTAPLVGFSPRKAHLVVYLVGGFAERYSTQLERLGPHRAGKGCLYLKRLADVDHEVLRGLVERTVRVHLGAERRAAGSGSQARSSGRPTPGRSGRCHG
jgi:hypothetical protein